MIVQEIQIGISRRDLEDLERCAWLLRLSSQREREFIDGLVKRATVMFEAQESECAGA